MKFDLLTTDGPARRGTVHLVHGEVQTPTFMPVGTYGTVKAMSPEELVDIGAAVVLGNTFHLWLRPGLEVIAAHGGLHRWAGAGAPLPASAATRAWRVASCVPRLTPAARWLQVLAGWRVILGGARLNIDLQDVRVSVSDRCGGVARRPCHRTATTPAPAALEPCVRPAFTPRPQRRVRDMH